MSSKNMGTIKIRLGNLKNLIRELAKEDKKKYHFGGSHPEESYSSELIDDPDFHEKSVYVPDDIKKKIKKWAQQMGLSTKKKEQ